MNLLLSTKNQKNMKHFKTLITLFLLMMGTSSSWAEVPLIKLNQAGWASFTCLDPGVVYTLPDNATAYVATDVDPAFGDYGKVFLKKVTKFGYGEGVFIHGEANDAFYPQVVEGGVSDVPSKESGNITVGCTTDTQLDYNDNAYVLATKVDGGQAGFYYVNSEVTVPAGKAYFVDPKAAGANYLSIVFEDGSEATGVKSVLVGAEPKAPTVFYSLSGQKVGKDYKGVVIGSDGKKYVK